MAWERDTSLKGLSSAVLIASPHFRQRFKSTVRWACCSRHTPSTSSVFPESTDLSDPSLTTATHSRRRCQRTHKKHLTQRRMSVCLHLLACMALECVCIPAWLNWQSAQRSKSRKRRADNVCECGRICKGFTAGIISIMVEGHQHSHTHTHTHKHTQATGTLCLLPTV